MRTRSGKRYGGSRPSNMTYRAAKRARYGRSRSNTMTQRRRSRSGLGVTTQHDERLIYRKRSMPRRMKRSWKRFKNKVHAVSEKDLGTRTVVFNATYGLSSVLPDNHTVGTFAVYGMSSSNLQLNDLSAISNLENSGDPTAAAGVTIDKTTKIIFKSGIMDLTFRNTSSKNGTGAVAEAKLETDIYECIVRKEADDTNTNYADFNEMLTRGYTDTKNIGGTGLGLNSLQRGTTPWDFPNALSYFGIKILKKTKFFTNNGDTFTYQIRDPRRHVVSFNRLQRAGGCNMPGLTRFIWVVTKLVPGLTKSVNTGDYTESLTIGCTRKYFYKVEGVNEDRDRYLQQ